MTLLLCCAQAAGHTASDRRGRQILRLEEEWRAAQRRNDRGAFGRLLSAADVTFIGTSGSFRDKAGFIASRGGSWIPHAEAYTYTEVLVRFYGGAAVVTGVEATTGEGVTARGRFTHVWAKRGGKWLLVVAIQRTEISEGR